MPGTDRALTRCRLLRGGFAISGLISTKFDGIRPLLGRCRPISGESGQFWCDIDQFCQPVTNFGRLRPAPGRVRQISSEFGQLCINFGFSWLALCSPGPHSNLADLPPPQTDLRLHEVSCSSCSTGLGRRDQASLEPSDLAPRGATCCCLQPAWRAARSRKTADGVLAVAPDVRRPGGAWHKAGRRSYTPCRLQGHGGTSGSAGPEPLQGQGDAGGPHEDDSPGVRGTPSCVLAFKRDEPR